MKKLIILLILMTGTLTLSAQFEKIVFSTTMPGHSESSAKVTLQSLGFALQNSDIEDGVKKLTYRNNREDRKNNYVFLYVEKSTVLKIEWRLILENDYSGEESRKAFNILESQLDALYGKSLVRFEKSDLINQQSFYPIEIKKTLQALSFQIIDNKGSVSFIAMDRDEAIMTIEYIRTMKSFQTAFQPYLDELYNMELKKGYDTAYTSCDMEECVIEDIDQDGFYDCIIKWDCTCGYLSCTHGGYAIFITKNDKPVLSGWHYQAYGKEYGSYIDIKRIDDKGIIHAIEHKYTDSDPRCCPSIETEKQFIFKNEELIEVK